MVRESDFRVVGLVFVIIAIFLFSYLFYLNGEAFVPLILLVVGIVLSFMLAGSVLGSRNNKK